MATSNSFAACARFDDFHVDLKGGILQRSGVRLPVQSQPLQVLRLLLQAQGKVVTRDELRKVTRTAVDPDTCWLLSRCDLQEGRATEASVMALARSYRKSNPVEPEPAPFVGEARCAQCHEDIFRA